MGGWLHTKINVTNDWNTDSIQIVSHALLCFFSFMILATDFIIIIIKGIYRAHDRPSVHQSTFYPIYGTLCLKNVP